jgi:hypothetical protein
MTTTTEPSYKLASTGAPRCPMTAFCSPSLGRLILANHLLAAIHQENSTSALLHFGSVKLKIEGKNLDVLCDHLAAHRVISVAVALKPTTSSADDPVVDDITLIKTAKKPRASAATPAPVPPPTAATV